MLRAGGVLWHTAVLQHLQRPGDTHHHRRGGAGGGPAAAFHRRAFGVTFDQLPAPSATRKRSFTITDPEKIQAVFRAFGTEATDTLALHINLGVLENDCCKASFVRGAFLSGGSITDPEKDYHLEIVTSHRSVSREFYSVMLELGFAPGEAQRGRAYVT